VAALSKERGAGTVEGAVVIGEAPIVRAGRTSAGGWPGPTLGGASPYGSSSQTGGLGQGKKERIGQIIHKGLWERELWGRRERRGAGRGRRGGAESDWEERGGTNLIRGMEYVGNGWECWIVTK